MGVSNRNVARLLLDKLCSLEILMSAGNILTINTVCLFAMMSSLLFECWHTSSALAVKRA